MLMLINTAAWAQRLHLRKQGRSPASSSVPLNSSSCRSRSSTGSAQLSYTSMPDHHTRLIQLLGLKTLDLTAKELSEEKLLSGCYTQLVATAKACYAAAAALSSCRFSAGSGSSRCDHGGSSGDGNGGNFNSIVDLVQRLHPQLRLVIVEVLALAPHPDVLGYGVDALQISKSLWAKLHQVCQSTAAVFAEAAAVSGLFQLLVQLVTPALLHAAGSEVGMSMPRSMADAQMRYAKLMFNVLAAKQSEWAVLDVMVGYTAWPHSMPEPVLCLEGISCLCALPYFRWSGMTVSTATAAPACSSSSLTPSLHASLPHCAWLKHSELWPCARKNQPQSGSGMWLESYCCCATA